MKYSNIFKEIPTDLKEEIFEDLISTDNIKIERIISYGHTTSNNEWYDQATNEWVILLQGKAIISFESEDAIELNVGDFINIPAYKRHRVSWTEPNKKTIWLAVHY